MKIFKNLAFALVIIFAAGLISCGENEPDPLSGKEILLDDLAGTWNLDAANSQLANLTIDASGISATFSETGYSLSGEITTYVDSGTYTISDEGVITAVDVNIKVTDLELEDGSLDVTVSSTNDKITIEFSTVLSAGRVSGLGDFKLVFDKAS
ncbi:MAG: hypothetical protein CMB80_17570 [Flammeovirgaceae bacterium]|nr:hypothetical protein [Flammeovirgaceae bacterium]MBE63228.1 hypothetical protein [Flammeovirgaceae bacterium]MBR07378.1 hypothetical protein [Rickettsiales bacterium]HCX21418.1 hypothetical protein [Cytophagales bacterium]|tara:strand:+ start:244 stop:702 length:459 start_codon:yes stop_codon:yes gene_type:complete